MGIVIGLIVLVAVFVIQGLVANLFEEVAHMKGHTNTKIVWRLCFWLGIVGCLYVVAYPNLNSQKDLNNSDGWKCPSCGRVNANYVGTCACGKHK